MGWYGDRLWRLAIEKSFGVAGANLKAPINPEQGCVDVIADGTGKRVEGLLPRKTRSKLWVGEEVSGAIVFGSVAAAKCLGDPLAKPSLGKRGVTEERRDELLKVAGRYWHLGNDLDSAVIARKIHSVVAAGGHKVPLLASSEWLIGAVVSLKQTDLARES